MKMITAAITFVGAASNGDQELYQAAPLTAQDDMIRHIYALGALGAGTATLIVKPRSTDSWQVYKDADGDQVDLTVGNTYPILARAYAVGVRMASADGATNLEVVAR